MRSFKQLDFFLRFFTQPPPPVATAPAFALRSGRDPVLEEEARELLRSIKATALLPLLRVEWNPRLRTAAGRASYRGKLVSLNPRLREHGEAEIDRTLRHELAHLVAHLRAGRRRISPHGPEWRQACCDLGIGDERRCHTLPFPTRTRARRYLYRCPKCAADFPRVRRMKRAVACLACCRRHNRGAYDKQFQLRLVRASPSG
jgi:predicted SprT family Zn-dependent metalloprotease